MTTVILNALTLTDGLGIMGRSAGGGAVFAVGNALEINDCLFVNNKAQGSDSTIGGEGGAIYAGITGQLIVVNSTFANNTAVHGTSIASEGGAIYAEFDT